jgi:hypothetical protein
VNVRRLAGLPRVRAHGCRRTKTIYRESSLYRIALCPKAAETFYFLFIFC